MKLPIICSPTRFQQVDIGGFTLDSRKTRTKRHRGTLETQEKDWFRPADAWRIYGRGRQKRLPQRDLDEKTEANGGKHRSPLVSHHSPVKRAQIAVREDDRLGPEHQLSLPYGFVSSRKWVTEKNSEQRTHIPKKEIVFWSWPTVGLSIRRFQKISFPKGNFVNPFGLNSETGHRWSCQRTRTSPTSWRFRQGRERCGAC